MKFTLKINRVEKIKEYNGMTGIIHSVHWSYAASEFTPERQSLRVIHGVENLELPTIENFTPIESVDYYVLKSWLESVLDFKVLEERLAFLLSVEMQQGSVNIIEGLDKLNQ